MTGSDSRPIRTDRPAARPIRRGWGTPALGGRGGRGRRRRPLDHVAGEFDQGAEPCDRLRKTTSSGSLWGRTTSTRLTARSPRTSGRPRSAGRGTRPRPGRRLYCRTWTRRSCGGAYDVTEPFDRPANAAVAGTVLKAFIDPHPDWKDRRTENGFGLSHYAGNVRVLGPGGTPRLPEIADGTTQTLYAGQIGGFPSPWADPDNLRGRRRRVRDRPPGSSGGPYSGGDGRELRNVRRLRRLPLGKHRPRRVRRPRHAGRGRRDRRRLLNRVSGPDPPAIAAPAAAGDDHRSPAAPPRPRPRRG